MSERTKALFYDIDGTLLSVKTGRVPESAKRALAEARERGHLVFINTGRVYCHLRQIKSQVEADGWLCGCGTYLVAEGKVLYEHHIPRARCQEIKRDVEACRLDGVLEGTEGCYMHRAPSRLPQVERMRGLLRQAECPMPYDWEDDCYQFDKLYLGSDGESRCRELFGRLRDLDIIDRGSGFYECVPRGHSKATAIEVVLRRYGIALEDAYVFGDSGNDLAMFEYAPNCVLMGDHSEVLRPYATFETKTVEEDGIAWAMRELGLIKGR